MLGVWVVFVLGPNDDIERWPMEMGVKRCVDMAHVVADLEVDTVA